MPTCAIYARVSTDHQGDSVDHQISLLKSVAKQRGTDWIVDERLVYRDDGKSGTSIVYREAMQRLLKDAENGLFDVVMFKGISRFARDVGDAETMLKILRSANVRVISFEESFDSAKESNDFLFTIYAAVAQEESKKIGIRTKLGLREIAKKGQWPKGRPPYGFIVDKESKHLKPNPEQMPIVQMVFDMYVNKGMGMVMISKYLNERGISPSIKPHWSQVTIRLLLINEAYIGRIVYGIRKIKKVFQAKDPMTPRMVNIRDRESDEVIVVENAHQAIVDEYTFFKAQEIMKTRRVARKRGDIHLLSGILRCPKCDIGMVSHNKTKLLSNGERKNYYYYSCANRRKYGIGVCDGPTVSADQIESLVIEMLQDELAPLSPEEIRQRVERNANPFKVNPRDILERLNHDIEDVQNQIVNANMNHAKKILDDSTLSVIIGQLSDKLNKLQDAKINLISKLNSLSNEEQQIDDFLRNIERFKKLDKITRDNKTEARSILERIVTRIRLHGDRVQLKFRLDISEKNLPTKEHV